MIDSDDESNILLPMRNQPASQFVGFLVLAEHLGRNPTAEECRNLGLSDPNSPAFEPLGIDFMNEMIEPEMLLPLILPQMSASCGL